MPLVRPPKNWSEGEVVRLEHQSEVLKNNPWQDPVKREVCIYLPSVYSDKVEPYIALWDLAAYTNSGPGHVNWTNQGENLPQRLDRLIGKGLMPPCVVVMPDCYTSLGGNQYVNSPAVGMYADYLNKELVPFVGANFNVVEQRDGRGIFGKSSGGFGALYHAMHWPGTWGAAASHAGDVGFDWVYRTDFPVAARRLVELNSDVIEFVRRFWATDKPSGRDFQTLMIIAMAASYDPDPGNPDLISLPFDIHTLEIDDSRWANWLRYDPLNLVEQHAEALRRLHALYIDVGRQDQYNIQYGTRRLFERLGDLEVRGQYEEFEGSHSGIDWRLYHSLPYIAHALHRACRP
jgi:enterochelin esterase-like enzyme